MEKSKYIENARKIIDLADGMTDTQWARVQHLITNCLSEKKAKSLYNVVATEQDRSIVVDGSDFSKVRVVENL